MNVSAEKPRSSLVALLVAGTAVAVGLGATPASTPSTGPLNPSNTKLPWRAEAPASLSALSSSPLPPGTADRADQLVTGECSSFGGSKTASANNPKGFDEASALSFGLQAYACGASSKAVQALGAAAGGGAGELEDWRLYALGQAHLALGQPAAAKAAFEKLLSDHRDSPLWPRTLEQTVGVCLDAGDQQRARELIRWGQRMPNLDRRIRTRLDETAWSLAESTDDSELAQITARRLLAFSPMEAGALKAVEIFRQPDGSLPWDRILSPTGLVLRARSLLDVDLAESAVNALDAVRIEHRDSKWTLLRAEAATEVRDGAGALRLLSTLQPTESTMRVDVAWARVNAYFDLASAAGGGASLSAEERLSQRRSALAELASIYRLDPQNERTHEALVRLFEELTTDQEFDRSLGVLRLLKTLDTDDRTGADYLWNLGWQGYRTKNYSSAIGYWTELWDLYPTSRQGRAGRYWSGRSYEALSNRERSQQIYREVTASDTTDFYRRHALARLGSLPAAVVEATEGEEAWPVDPGLGRAWRLTELGTSELALVEIDAQDGHVDPRAAYALKALVYARQGKHRQSIPELRKAFPALGGPFQAGLPLAARKLYYPLAYEDGIREAAQVASLPPHLVFGIIRRESAFDLTAKSSAGASGLMQLMPATAREIAHKLGLTYSRDRLTSDPVFNVRLGTTYFRQVLDMFNGQEELALAGYNGGPYRIKRLWNESSGEGLDTFVEDLGIPESKSYVKWILVLSDSYRSLYS